MNTQPTHRTSSPMRQMTLMGLRYLSTRKLRTTLTTLAIVFGVALIFSIDLVLPSVTTLFKQSLSPLTGADLTMTSMTGDSFAPDVVDRVAGVDGVQAVTGILHRAFMTPSSNGTEQVDVYGIDPQSIAGVRQFVVSEGRFLEPGDTGAAILPARLAEISDEISLGQTFILPTASGIQRYTVVGLLADTNAAYTAQIYVTLPDAQAIFNQPGLINTLEIAFAPGADRATVTAAVQSTLGDNFTIESDGATLSAFPAIEAGYIVLNLLGVLALFLGAFLIFNTFRTVVLERRRDIGMLRAIGATRRQITLLIVIESLIQGVVGTLIGLLLGYLLAFGMTSFVNPILGSIGFAGSVQLQMNTTALLLAAGLGLVTALLAGYLPARAAGRTTPMDALRPATFSDVQRVARWNLIAGLVVMVVAFGLLASGSQNAAGGAFLFLVGMLLAAPGLVIPAARLFSPLLTLWFAREGDLARNNLLRQPSRAAITGSTLMIGLAVLVLVAALVSALSELTRSLADVNFSSDILLLPQTVAVYDNVIGADASLATELEALPDIATVGSLRYAESSVDEQALQVLAIDPAKYPQVASFEFIDGDPDRAFAALGSGRNAIISSLAQASLGVALGDDMVMQTAEGPQTYHIVGIAHDILTFKLAVAFISQDNLLADFHKAEDVMLLLNVTPGADRTAALAEVEAVAADYPQFTARLTGEYREELVATSSNAFVLVYALAVLILIPAALGLLNTLTINVLERTREIGVVRAVGGSRRQVRRMVTAEALLLGVFSAAMGVLAGIAMSYGFVAALSAFGWSAPYTFPVIGIVAAVVVGVLLALFAAILPARSAAQLDIVRALQYE